MVFYFTATGNSLYAARGLDLGEPVSIAQAIHSETKQFRDERIGIVCPIFGHEMPELVKDFLEQARFETDYFFLLLTYGARHGGAAEIAEQFLRKHGLEPAYINVLLMADNFLPAFDMDEQKRQDKKVEEHLAEIRAEIQSKKRMIAPVTEQDREVHRQYLAFASQLPADAYAHMYRVTDDCVACGVCAKVCPKSCYIVENHRAVWNPSGCIGCMACIHACAQKAIQLNMPEKNPRARYRNPHVRLTDLIAANRQQ